MTSNDLVWLPQGLDHEVHLVDIQRIPMVDHNHHSIWPWPEKSQMIWFWTNAAQEDSFPRLKMIPKTFQWIWRNFTILVWFPLRFEKYPAEISTLIFGIIPGQSGILYLSHGCVLTSSSASDITFQSKIMVIIIYFFLLSNMYRHM